jgi:hypothetical protein
MTTQISPGIGHAPLFNQGGVGGAPGYDAVDIRRALGGPMQEGVMHADSYEVTQRGAGANMSVDIAASTIDAATGAAAYVQGDAATGQGLYSITGHTAVINEAMGAAHATLPRVDRVILEVQDHTHDASGANLVRTRVVAGTATAGATLNNLTGAAAVPASALLLADVLVGAAAASITNAVIRDRRKWARGAFLQITRTSANYTVAGASDVEIDTTNLKPRLECSGNPVIVTLSGTVQHNVATGSGTLKMFLDGVLSAGSERVQSYYVPGTPELVGLTWVIVPAAGSHLFSPAWNNTAGSGLVTFFANAGQALSLTIEEVVRQNTANNASTSG